MICMTFSWILLKFFDIEKPCQIGILPTEQPILFVYVLLLLCLIIVVNSHLNIWRGFSFYHHFSIAFSPPPTFLFSNTKILGGCICYNLGFAFIGTQTFLSKANLNSSSTCRILSTASSYVCNRSVWQRSSTYAVNARFFFNFANCFFRNRYVHIPFLYRNNSQRVPTSATITIWTHFSGTFKFLRGQSVHSRE